MANFFSELFLGSPEKHKRISTLTQEQQDLLSQLQQALQGGNEGAFGSAADYYRQILNDNPELMEQFFSPEMRKFNQEIIPGLSEQFAGLGSGALSSSGFRNSAVQAGTDLQERLAAMRANLKSQAAQGLSGLGQLGLGNYTQDVVTQPGPEGLFSQLGPSLVNAGIGYLTSGPAGAATSVASGGINRNSSGNFGSSSPYGRMTR